MSLVIACCQSYPKALHKPPGISHRRIPIRHQQNRRVLFAYRSLRASNIKGWLHREGFSLWLGVRLYNALRQWSKIVHNVLNIGSLHV